jgi:DNA-binding CsgD family transcriptional regulator/tetratricopeptide (TPR) repeat protein
MGHWAYARLYVDSRPSAIRARIVGRERELAQREAALDGLGEGAPAYLTLEGEPGIGKTRLLDELRARADDRGHVVLSGAAAEFERELPFSVWVDALDAYVVSQDFAQHEAWDAGLAAELGQVLPSLRSANGGAGTVADERFQAHRAVSRLLGLVAENQPLVLVLDDLQWSDSASIELIGALSRREPEAPVLIALAFRPGRVALRLGAALTGARVRRLELEPLSKAEAALLLEALDAETAAAVYRHGGGNPFYLEQLGRGGDGGALATRPEPGGPAAETGVPAAVAAAIAGELDSLSDESRVLLNAAAVAGEPFEVDLAAAVAGLQQAEALAALDDLLDTDLIRPTDVPRRFVFRHPLVRRAVYESVRGGWRLAAHARAADALAARGADAAERAHHVEQSAAQGDAAAIELLLDAGRSAAPRAPEAAARWFEAALRLLPSGDSDRQVSIRVSLASALRSSGELERCRAALLEAMDLLPPESVVRRVDLTTLCAAVEHWQGRHEDAHHRLERAWDDIPDQTTSSAAALQIELAVDGLYELDYAQTLAMGRGALETARALGDGALIAAAASALCLGEAAEGDIDSAREHRQEALRHIDPLPDEGLAPRLEALYYLGWAENYLEHYDEAIAHADRGIAIARAAGEGRLLVPMMLVKGYPFEMQGRMADAVELCENAIEAARLSANPHYLFWALFELGWAHYFSGDLDAALLAGEESKRVGGRLVGGTMPSTGGGPGWLLAAARFEAGDVERAREEMRALGSDELEHKIPVERCFDWETMALAELAAGRPEAAEGYARRAEENAERLGLKVPAACAGRARAAVLLDAGEPLEAAGVAAESAEAAASVGARLQAAYSRGLAGRALAAAGERKAALDALKEAERETDLCGSTRFRDEMRRELRKLGARAEVRGPATADDSGIASLTKREREIAELITDRLTNPQIASKLFLSKKTVESHIRNLFVKLGASSRVEVARIVERERREGPGLTDAP